MREYKCHTCGANILLEASEVLQHGAYCGEHVLDQLPALKQLADEASETEEQRGHPAKSHRAAEESTTEIGAETMSDHTLADRFVPGMDEHTLPSFTDIDGEVYPGEYLRRTNSLTIMGEAEDVASVHTYDVFDDTGQQLHAIRLVLVDDMDHSAQVTLPPVQLQQVAQWLTEQAQKLIPGGDAA